MADALKRSPEGWWLPHDDTVFEKYAAPPEFMAGPPPKRGGFYREHLLEAFKYVRAWDVAVDVGAHCGFWCYELAQRFKTVHAFEPSPANHECLVRNLADFENVNLWSVAVGAGPGRCEIKNDRQRPGNSGSNYIQPGAGEIPIVGLDELELPGCDLLKVDVEGFELRVLQGARKLIRDCKPVVIMEVTDHKFVGRYPGIVQGDAQRWLLKRGYKMVWNQGPDAIFCCG